MIKKCIIGLILAHVLLPFICLGWFWFSPKYEVVEIGGHHYWVETIWSAERKAQEIRRQQINDSNPNLATFWSSAVYFPYDCRFFDLLPKAWLRREPPDGENECDFLSFFAGFPVERMLPLLVFSYTLSYASSPYSGVLQAGFRVAKKTLLIVAGCVIPFLGPQLGEVVFCTEIVIRNYSTSSSPEKSKVKPCVYVDEGGVPLVQEQVEYQDLMDDVVQNIESKTWPGFGAYSDTYEGLQVFWSDDLLNHYWISPLVSFLTMIVDKFWRPLLPLFCGFSLVVLFSYLPSAFRKLLQ